MSSSNSSNSRRYRSSLSAATTFWCAAAYSASMSSCNCLPLAASMIPLGCWSHRSLNRSAMTSASRATPRVAARCLSSSDTSLWWVPARMLAKLCRWLRSSRVATRIWWTESHSSRRTRGSYANNLSRLRFNAAITPAVGEFGSRLLSTMGSVGRSGPNAIASFDGLFDAAAPARVKTSVAAAMRVDGAAGVTSTSHSRQLVAVSDFSDVADTWSSQNSATTVPAASPNSVSCRSLSTWAMGDRGSSRTIERTIERISSGIFVP